MDNMSRRNYEHQRKSFVSTDIQNATELCKFRCAYSTPGLKSQSSLYIFELEAISNYRARQAVGTLSQYRKKHSPRPAAPLAFARRTVVGSKSHGHDDQLPVQAKLTVGPPGDRYEQEADRVADQVMSTAAPTGGQAVQREANPEEEVQTKPLSASITPLIQREAAPEEEEIQTKAIDGSVLQREQDDEEELQTKRLPDAVVQREGEEDELQTKPELQSLKTKSAQPGLEDRLEGRNGNGSPLPGGVRSFMENRFGFNFGNVRVHSDSEAVQMNRELNAQAFTHGSNIYFNDGRYNPDTHSGRHLLAHELTHVIQQTGGVQVAHRSERGNSSVGNLGNSPLVSKAVQCQTNEGIRLDQSSGAAASSTTITIDNKTHDVHGKSLSQVYDSMTSGGAREAASVLPVIKPDPQYEYDDGDHVKKVVVNIQEVKTMPNWVELNRQCTPIQNEWNRFFSSLNAHEDRHIAIDRGFFTDVHKKLIGKKKEDAWKKFDEIVEAADKANQDYDSSSDHGQTEGTKINGAIQCEVEKLSEEESSATMDSADA
jgi:predicted secreted Zn-dependent protease